MRNKTIGFYSWRRWNYFFFLISDLMLFVGLILYDIILCCLVEEKYYIELRKGLKIKQKLKRLPKSIMNQLHGFQSLTISLVTWTIYST